MVRLMIVLAMAVIGLSAVTAAPRSTAPRSTTPHPPTTPRNKPKNSGLEALLGPEVASIVAQQVPGISEANIQNEEMVALCYALLANVIGSEDNGKTAQQFCDKIVHAASKFIKKEMKKDAKHQGQAAIGKPVVEPPKKIVDGSKVVAPQKKDPKVPVINNVPVPAKNNIPAPVVNDVLQPAVNNPQAIDANQPQKVPNKPPIDDFLNSGNAVIAPASNGVPNAADLTSNVANNVGSVVESNKQPSIFGGFFDF